MPGEYLPEFRRTLLTSQAELLREVGRAAEADDLEAQASVLAPRGASAHPSAPAPR